MTILFAALIVLAVTALGGLAAAAFRARGSNPPMWLAIIHGVAAASGLVLLSVSGVLEGFSTPLAVGLGLLVVSALGGFVLFGTHLRAQIIHGPLVLVHGLISFSGFLAVVVAAFA